MTIGIYESKLEGAIQQLKGEEENVDLWYFLLWLLYSVEG